MTTHLRSSTISTFGLFALLMGRGSAAQTTGGAPTPATPTIEIDYSALVIDVASERRALDAAIRREVARRESAERARELKLAASGMRRGG
jgi:hypothetical protein